jgi:peptidoglycan/xylan/chitin deacetylase (PgdA/CDA1 family)
VDAHNARLTFFVYSGMSGWRSNQRRMQPFIDSGHIQIANHTHRHPDLRNLSAAKIHRELLECHRFIEDVYGVDSRPYFRPPYGAYNNRVREVAADLGYTKLMMWSGTLGDSGHISLAREYTFGRRYMNNGTVLLGHANNMNADKLFERLYRVTTSRNLEMVTLQDAMGPAFRPDPAPVSPTASPIPVI